MNSKKIKAIINFEAIFLWAAISMLLVFLPIKANKLQDSNDNLRKCCYNDSSKIYNAVEEMPMFPGGESAIMEYLQKNLRYPSKASENNIEGCVIVRFVVGMDGSISNVTVARGVHPSLDEEAVRVIEKMPKWTPGKQNGSPVNVYYTMPITFKLQ